MPEHGDLLVSQGALCAIIIVAEIFALIAVVFLLDRAPCLLGIVLGKWDTREVLRMELVEVILSRYSQLTLPVPAVVVTYDGDNRDLKLHSHPRAAWVQIL